ncbi:hypothetical protein ACCUM_1318 [Candidatus Accumulibacter phosphatis]|uniref:Uncharacterized protein n=1 Tax=Candidatus Accumulibacter phosphatis TaxID=327160 RepID=A0A5S4EGK8_9PROT|nr:hypothetical protein ACCUM_1318 [Candidatus Accumulibacter phosphatis]
MDGAFLGLLISLKAIAQLIQQNRYGLTTNPVALLFKGRRQLTGTQTGPP